MASNTHLRRSNMKSRLAALVSTLLLLSACSDTPTAASDYHNDVLTAAASKAAKAAQPASAVRWNAMALSLFRARGGNPGRSSAYLTLAQYRAALAATDARHGQTRPSPAGAVAGASVVILKQFYPLDAAAIDAELAAQRAVPPFGKEHNLDFEAGEAMGRTIGVAMLGYAAGDNFGRTSPGLPPGTPNTWTSSGAPIVRGGFGARPFFLTSGSELRPSAPPPFGSPAFLTAIAEVRTIALSRTAAQTAIAQKWIPFSAPYFNAIANDLIEKYNSSELEAARILAYANVAAFDAIIACFDTKFAFWFIRPTQADPSIPLAPGVPLPNHPSFPAAHSCETGAFHGVLADAFPRERAMLDAVAQEASISRVYGGIHYRFDGEAGLVIGESAARLALQRGLE
ncbi:MAG: vanadium-dependent haloperoxidase, partial [Gemmatimonas sp.]